MSEKWHLWVCLPENISEDERYFLITEKYCLLYSPRRPEGPVREVEKLSALPSLAWEWLADAIADIRRRYMAEHQEEILAAAKDFNERFAGELEAERKRIEGGDTDR